MKNRKIIIPDEGTNFDPIPPSTKGFYTTFSMGYPGCCIWYGCRKKPFEKTQFCEEHGKIEVKIQIVE